MKVILISFLFFGVAWANLTCECGKRNAGRIVGGKKTKKNEYPWMVAIQEPKKAFTYCGGTIVTTWHVVTAAHCVERIKAEDLALVVGAHDVHDFNDPTTQRLPVAQLIVHPYYCKTTSVADLALLVTSTEIVFNDDVGPACMPTKVYLDEMIGQMLKIIGWGRYDPKVVNNDEIKNLREVDVKVQSVFECMGYNAKKICTYSPGKDACSGDSGGPAVWLDPDVNRYTLVGVVSTGPTDCGNSDFPAELINVGFYREWLEMWIEYTKSEAKICHKV